MEIKTLGDFRKITKDFDDDFKLDVRIVREVPEEELKQRLYPYPWDMFDATIEIDVGYSDKVKVFCIYVCKK